jgi:ankyrin repeat protein
MRGIRFVVAEAIVMIALWVWPACGVYAQTPTANPVRPRLNDIFSPAPEGGPEKVRAFIEKIKVAIDNGADIDATDQFGNNPLLTATYWASWSYHDWGANDVVAFLLSRGANPNVGHKSFNGATPLHFAAQSLWANAKLIELLCAAGADAKAKVHPLGVSALEVSQSSSFPQIKRAMDTCAPKQ